MNNIIFKTTFLKGEDGNNILRIDKTATSGLVDTYTITLTDGTTTTFNVTNGSSIATIEKTATVGMVDTYTITLTDGSTFTFEVTNGASITIDDHLDANSTNPVENRVVTGAINTLNDNLTVQNYTAVSATGVSTALAEYIAQANMTDGETRRVNIIYTASSTTYKHYCEITRIGNNYNGFLFDATDADWRYTFTKVGGASIETRPFKTAPTLIGLYNGNQTINVSSYLKSGDTVNNFIVEFVKINSGNSAWVSGSDQIVCQVRNLGSTLSKTLSGNNLIISGATNKDEVWKADNTSGSDPTPITAVNVNVEYKVWYV